MHDPPGGNQKIHFQSTTEMKINTICWGRVAGQLGKRISSSTLSYPNTPYLFSSLHSY